MARPAASHITQYGGTVHNTDGQFVVEMAISSQFQDVISAINPHITTDVGLSSLNRESQDLRYLT